MDLENRDAELETLLEKYGATGRRNTGSKMLTPDRVPTVRLRRFMSRDEEPKPNPDNRPRGILCENQSLRRPSPIRRDSDSEDWKPRSSQSPIANQCPKSPISKEIGESKAFAMAMKALQDRVKFLEGENARLQDEKGRFSRGQEQFYSEIDKGDRISALSVELRETSTALTKAEKEVKSLTDELRRARETIDRLQSDQFRRADRSLEARCHSYEEQTIAQKAQIDQLRREIEEMRQSAKPESRSVLFTPKNRGKSQLDCSAEEGRHVATEGDYLESTRTAYFGEASDEEKRNPDGFLVNRLENELEDCSQRYKSLLQQCQDPHTDLSALRSELNVIAAAMESKNSQLASLPRPRAKKFYGYV